MKKSLIIACDGEAASGKSTGAKLISKKYKLLLINSGLLYRYASKLIIDNKPKKFNSTLRNFLVIDCNCLNMKIPLFFSTLLTTI